MKYHGFGLLTAGLLAAGVLCFMTGCGKKSEAALAQSGESEGTEAERVESESTETKAVLFGMVGTKETVTQETEASESAQERETGQEAALADAGTDAAQEAAEAEAAEAAEAAAADTKEAQTEPMTVEERYLEGITGTSQMILVIGDGSAYGAVLSYYEKTGSGWEEIFETEAQIGQNGFNDHTIEGDKTTPTGRFELGIAFGNRSNPGTALTWIDVNPYLYWIDDLNSEYYNQLIDSREIPDGWSSGEHLEEYVNSYAYAVNIEVNPGCTKDSTSAIFLHCFGNNPYTLGCVAISESRMVALLQSLSPGAQITIANSETQLAAMTD